MSDNVNRQAAAEIVDALARHQVSYGQMPELFRFVQNKVGNLPIHYQMLQDQARKEVAIHQEPGTETRG